MAIKSKKKAKAKAKKAQSSKARTTPKASKPARKARKTKPRADCHNELITIKVTPAELDMIYSRADKLARGNVSALLRHAARVCKTRAPETPRKAA